MLTKHRDRCGSVLETWVYGELRKNLALSDLLCQLVENEAKNVP